jgi:hypothetical protein
MIDNMTESAKPIFHWFMEATAEKDAMRCTFLAYYNKIVKIQRANRRRLTSLQLRASCLHEYWDSTKTDIAKALVRDKKIQRKSSKVQMRLMQTLNSYKDVFFQRYIIYKKTVYLIKYLFWRLLKLQFKDKQVEYDWLTEIKEAYKIVLECEKFLFEGID